MHRSAVFLIVLVACGPDRAPRLSGPRDAGPDSDALDADHDAALDSGLASPDCEERARWIYVFDESNRLLRFEPDSGTFHPVSSAGISCGASPGATPFSMAIDRDAIAWVLYSDGSIHRASTVDGACESTGYVTGQSGMGLFGMGFSADAPLSSLETLYIAGPGMGGQLFATLDTTTFVITPRGNVVGSPELTGNALAQLWAFDPASTPARIDALNRSNGSALVSYDLSTVGPDTLTEGALRAWAFAFWGGDYWAFYRSADETSTDVYRFRPPNEGTPASFTRIVDDTTLTIVGAGISTCAPFVIE